MSKDMTEVFLLRGQGRPRYNQDTRNFILFFLFFIVSGASSSGFPFLRGQGRPRYNKTSTEAPLLQSRYPELISFPFFFFFSVSRASSSGFPFARTETPSLHQNRTTLLQSSEQGKDTFAAKVSFLNLP